MANIISFIQELFGNVNVSAVVAVFVLVWLWGQLGLTGKQQLLSSFATGVVLGVADKFFNGQLVNGSAWWIAILYGIILGGLASGAYEGIKSAVAHGMLETFDLLEVKQEPPQG